jgi:hypothetical protein
MKLIIFCSVFIIAGKMMCFIIVKHFYKICYSRSYFLLVYAAPTIHHNYELVPDTEGYMHLVDLATYEADVEALFDPLTDIVFSLYTRSNPTNGQIVHLKNAASLAASNFNAAHPTRITVHGWNGVPSSPQHVNSG